MNAVGIDVSKGKSNFYSVFPICLAPFIINGSLSSFFFHSNRYSSIFLFKYIELPPFFKAITFYEDLSIYFSRFMSLYS